MSIARHAFGWEELDRALGGGLLPGTLTVVAGATGVGKTQLGLRWAQSGQNGEGRRGVICDLTSRGDSQNHAEYASRTVRLGPERVSADECAELRPRLGFHAADRRLFPPDRPRRPTGHARRSRGRAVARMEERPGADLPMRSRLLLSAFRARLPAGRLRRPGAGRAVQRIDPVRVLRVHLPPRPAQGGRMGRPGVAPGEVPGVRRRRC